MKDLQKFREQMVALCLESFHEGLFTGTSGNLSVYLKDEGLMLITPTSVRYDIMRPEDIVLCDLAGNIKEGHLNPSSEWRMHAIVYQNYPDTGSVFHTHSPYATAFAVVHKAIPATLIETHFFLGGTVECAAYATPGTDGVGLNAIPVLKGKGGCLLANHGVLAVGEDMAQAKLRAEYIEDSAKIYQYACALGEPVVLPQL